MSRINRRGFLALATALLPSFLFSKAQASAGFDLAKAASTNGVLIAKSTSIKIGQTQVYSGKDSNGQNVEVILSRTKSGLVALKGTCTHQGCTIALEKTELVCPCHGSVFQANSGAVISGPNGAPKNSIKALAKFKVTEKSGNIYLK